MEQLLQALSEARWPEERAAIGREPVTECAWCNRDAGIPQGNGSHGICERHRDQMIAESQIRRVRKVA